MGFVCSLRAPAAIQRTTRLWFTYGTLRNVQETTWSSLIRMEYLLTIAAGKSFVHVVGCFVFLFQYDHDSIFCMLIGRLTRETDVFLGFTSTCSRCAFLSRKVVGELLGTLSIAVSPDFVVLVIALLLLLLLLL